MSEMKRVVMRYMLDGVQLGTECQHLGSLLYSWPCTCTALPGTCNTPDCSWRGAWHLLEQQLCRAAAGQASRRVYGPGLFRNPPVPDTGSGLERTGLVVRSTCLGRGLCTRTSRFVDLESPDRACKPGTRANRNECEALCICCDERDSKHVGRGCRCLVDACSILLPLLWLACARERDAPFLPEASARHGRLDPGAPLSRRIGSCGKRLHRWVAARVF